MHNVAATYMPYESEISERRALHAYFPRKSSTRQALPPLFHLAGLADLVGFRQKETSNGTALNNISNPDGTSVSQEIHTSKCV